MPVMASNVPVGATFAMLVMILVLQTTSALPGYRSQIPNADRVPDDKNGGFVTAIGHVDGVNGGGANNNFALDFVRNNKFWSLRLCQADSDGDGFTNGQELGDPDCIWSPGNTPSRTVNITHPGVNPNPSSAAFALTSQMSVIATLFVAALVMAL